MSLNVSLLVGRELLHRRWSTLAGLLILTAAIAGVTFISLASQAASDRTRLVQRDIGLNLRIIPQETELDDYWLRGYSDKVFDESLLTNIASQEVANRLVPMLQRTITWGQSEVVLTGVGEEIFSANEKGKPVFGGIQKSAGRLTVGALAAATRQLKVEDQVELLGKRFTIERILASNGSIDDIRIYATLDEVQSLLNLPGKLNEIRALECHCAEDVKDPEEYIRSILEPVLPGTQIIRLETLAEARRKQRAILDRFSQVVSPILLTFAVLAMGAMATINVYQRKDEIGLFTTLGIPTWNIALLFWLRSALIGISSGILGVLLGYAIFYQFGSHFAGTSTANVAIGWTAMFFGASLGFVVASIGSLVPTVIACRLDPAIALRGEE